jgi:hypothetical protein
LVVSAEHFHRFVATCIGFDEVTIVFKTLQVEGAQPFDQAQIDERRFLSIPASAWIIAAIRR